MRAAQLAGHLPPVDFENVVAICTPTPCTRQESMTGKPPQTQVSRRLSLGHGGLSPPESEGTYDEDERSAEEMPKGRRFGGVLQGGDTDAAPEAKKARPAAAGGAHDKENLPPSSPPERRSS